MNLSISCCAERHSDRSRRKRGLWTNPPTFSIWLIAINTLSAVTSSFLPRKMNSKITQSLWEFIKPSVCASTQSELRFAYLSRLHRNRHYRWQRAGEENFFFRCPVLLSLCVEWKDVLLRFQFSGVAIRTMREEEEEKSLGTLKSWMKGLSVVTVMNDRSMFSPRTSSQQSNQV